ncbi:matrix Gla protein [Narcine bancroftii]|uniref:matrix Gla protein n=1 Tax=Narcine bancroftii TaxID=1343680 RepID=UPI003831F52E
MCPHPSFVRVRSTESIQLLYKGRWSTGSLTQPKGQLVGGLETRCEINSRNKMRTLILLGLCALTAVCVTDSSESNEIDDVLFLGRRDANSFMRPAKQNYFWERLRYKSPQEMNREKCEEYWPCDLLARQVGHRQAYDRVFNNDRRSPSGPRQSRPFRQRGSRTRKHYHRY